MKDVPTRTIVAKPRTEKAFACYDPSGNLCITTLAMNTGDIVDIDIVNRC